MKARWRRVRAWSPSFAEEVLLTWGLSLLAAVMVGVSATAAIRSPHERHAPSRMAKRS